MLLYFPLISLALKFDRSWNKMKEKQNREEILDHQPSLFPVRPKNKIYSFELLFKNERLYSCLLAKEGHYLSPSHRSFPNFKDRVSFLPQHIPPWAKFIPKGNVSAIKFLDFNYIYSNTDEAILSLWGKGNPE